MKNSPLTVLQVVPQMDCGATARDVVEYALAVKETGGVPLVVSNGGKLVNELRRHGVEHFTADIASRFNTLKNVRLLKTLIAERGVDIVHARGRAAAACVKKAVAKTDVPFVTSYDGPYDDGKFGLKKSYNSVLFQGNAVFAPSLFVKDSLQKRFGVSEEKIHLIPSCIDEKRFDISAVSMDRMIAQAKKWRLPDDVPVLFFPTYHRTKKEYQTVLNALTQMRHKDFLCLFVNESKLSAAQKGSFENKIRKMGLTEVVRYIDGCAEPELAYALADIVLCLRSKEEAFSRSVLETQYMGRLAVAYDHGGVPELIENGETGFLAKPDDASDLANVLDAALDLPFENRQKIIARSRDFVKLRFGQKAVRAAVANAYRTIALKK